MVCGALCFFGILMIVGRFGQFSRWRCFCFGFGISRLENIRMGLPGPRLVFALSFTFLGVPSIVAPLPLRFLSLGRFLGYSCRQLIVRIKSFYLADHHLFTTFLLDRF
jgi:hypothetical protein